MSQAEAVRLFLAVDLDADLKAALATYAHGLRRVLPGASWVRPELLHITLRFLGDTPVDQVDRIAAACKPVVQACEPFRISVRGFGVFPHARHPTVVWAGVDGNRETLVRLAEGLRSALDLAGFGVERRAFAAHITLARVRRPARLHGQEIVRALAQRAEATVGHTEVRQVIVCQSTLTPTGPLYRALRQLYLGSG